MCRVVILLDDDPAEAAVIAQRAITRAGRVGATWFLGSLRNYLVTALVMCGHAERAFAELEGSLDRLLNGGAAQSAANTARGLVALAAQLDAAEESATLVGWLASNPVSMAGTPGMRARVASIDQRLRSSSVGFIGERLAAGAVLDLPAAIAEMVSLLERLRRRLDASATQEDAGGWYAVTPAAARWASNASSSQSSIS